MCERQCKIVNRGCIENTVLGKHDGCVILRIRKDCKLLHRPKYLQKRRERIILTDVPVQVTSSKLQTFQLHFATFHWPRSLNTAYDTGHLKHAKLQEKTKICIYKPFNSFFLGYNMVLKANVTITKLHTYFRFSSINIKTN